MSFPQRNDARCHRKPRVLDVDNDGGECVDLSKRCASSTSRYRHWRERGKRQHRRDLRRGERCNDGATRSDIRVECRNQIDNYVVIELMGTPRVRDDQQRFRRPKVSKSADAGVDIQNGVFDAAEQQMGMTHDASGSWLGCAAWCGSTLTAL